MTGKRNQDIVLSAIYSEMQEREKLRMITRKPAVACDSNVLLPLFKEGLESPRDFTRRTKIMPAAESLPRASRHAIIFEGLSNSIRARVTAKP